MSVQISRPRFASQHENFTYPDHDPVEGSSQSASWIDLGRKPSIVSTDFPEYWVKHAQETSFRKIVIVNSDSDGGQFDDLVQYLKQHPEACENVREITLAGAPHSHTQLLTETLSQILMNALLPNLRTLTIRNLQLVHLEHEISPVPDQLDLYQLALENIDDVTAEGILWVLSHFARVEYLILRDVGVVHDVIRHDVNYHTFNPWHIFDVSHLRLPAALKVASLDVRGSCSSRFYMNVMRSTPSALALRRVSVSCAHADDFVSLGGLIRDLGSGLTGISVSMSDCFRFGANSLDGAFPFTSHCARHFTDQFQMQELI